VVTDVEGTVTSIAFVKDVLFPYAKEHLPDFVRANRDTDKVADLLAQARELGKMPNADIEETISLLQSWITQDRKAPPLKALQGMIWQAGYQNGEIKEAAAQAALRLFVRLHPGAKADLCP
jgi:enolase-phosphatase E1